MTAMSATMPGELTDCRVLFVDHAAVLGGAELSLLDLATAYRDRCQILLFDRGPFCDRISAAHIPMQVIPAPPSLLGVRASGGLNVLKAFPALGWMAHQVVQESQGFDVIHTNSQKAFAAAALARWLGAPPVIWHLRDILTANHFSTLNRWLVIALANAQASQVIVNSQATGEAFVAAGGRPDLVRLVYNGVSVQPFENAQLSDTHRLRSDLGIPPDVPVVGSFSRLSYWKGQHILLKAVRNLPNVHVLLVGKALFGEDQYVTELQTLAEAPELVGRIHWLGFRTDIPSLMAVCTIIAHTSTEPEPFGRVIVEGQLAQRPVIATAAGGAIELIKDGETGRLVPPNNYEALSTAIFELLKNPEKVKLLATQGYNQARSNFSLDSLLIEFDKVLSDVYYTNR